MRLSNDPNGMVRLACEARLNHAGAVEVTADESRTHTHGSKISSLSLLSLEIMWCLFAVCATRTMGGGPLVDRREPLVHRSCYETRTIHEWDGTPIRKNSFNFYGSKPELDVHTMATLPNLDGLTQLPCDVCVTVRTRVCIRRSFTIPFFLLLSSHHRSPSPFSRSSCC